MLARKDLLPSEISKLSIAAHESCPEFLFERNWKYPPVYASEPMILQIVTKFLHKVVDISKEHILDDIGYWIRKIRFDINTTCCSLKNWTTFIEILAHELGTSCADETGYTLLLQLLTNAAFLRRFPECPDCGSVIAIEPNFIVFTCKKCSKLYFG